MLSGAFEYAVAKRLIRRNPAKSAKKPKPATPETPSWSPEQVRDFLGDPAVRSHELYALIRVAAYTGLRRGELAGLKWADIDFAASTIEVRHNAVEVQGNVTVGPPKTERSRRTVKIGASTVEVLQAHQAAQGAHRQVMGDGWRDRDLVFPRVDGLPRRPTTISLAFAALVAHTDLPPVTLHGLRHSHGTHLLEAGWPVHVVAARLGHDPATLLRTYAHAKDGSQDRIEGMEALLDGTPPALRVLDGEDGSETGVEEPRRAVL